MDILHFVILAVIHSVNCDSYIGELDTFCPMEFVKNGFSDEVFGSQDFPLAVMKKVKKLEADAVKSSIVTAPWLEWSENMPLYDYFKNKMNLMSCVHNLTLEDCVKIDRTCFDSRKFMKLSEITLEDKFVTQKERYPLALCFFLCTKFFLLKELPKDNYRTFCPDPCRYNPCKKVRHSTTVCTATGLISREFYCECEKGYEWSQQSLLCIPTDPCQSSNDEIYPCSRKGTIFCHFKRETQESVCLCEDTHMGTKCEKIYDACESKSGPSHLWRTTMAGNIACNVNNGNRCTHIKALNTYQCECNQFWTSSMNFSFDNCLQKQSKCNTLVCINGNCIESADGTQASCKCEAGFIGESCHSWRGEWSKWSVWYRCQPSCGRNRYTIRKRMCLSSKAEGSSTQRRECVGQSQEFERCADQSCSYVQEDIVLQIFSIHRIYFYTAILSNFVLAVIVTITWRAAFRGLLFRAVKNAWMTFKNRDFSEETFAGMEDVWGDNTEHQ